MSVRDWAVWRWDIPTLWVGFWMLQFAVIEWLTSAASPIQSWHGNMVTDHWRPIFHSAPITWWITLAVWLWLFPHFLWPGLEHRIRELVSR